LSEIDQKLDALIHQIFGIAEELEKLAKVYRDVVDEQKALLEEVKSGKYTEDFKVVLDELRRVLRRVRQQPSVYHEECEPDYPVLGRLFEKGIVRGDVARGTLKVDRDSLLRAILEGRLSSVEKVAALRALASSRGG
jgi:hypothetical protein